ncbi:MAG: hypothetical protein RIC56_00935 [Pseudomonadales bacterium]
MRSIRLGAPARLIRLAVMALMLCACASGSDVRRNEDGSISIQCSGGYHDWSGCRNRATRACGSAGFEIVSQVSDEGSSSVGTRDWSAEGSVVERTMVVRCKPPL